MYFSQTLIGTFKLTLQNFCRLNMCWKITKKYFSVKIVLLTWRFKETKLNQLLQHKIHFDKRLYLKKLIKKMKENKKLNKTKKKYNKVNMI